MNAQDYFSIINNVSEADYIVKSKFRGINPWVLSESECRRITEIDEKLAEEYEETKHLINNGWLIKIHP